ncbi:CHAT domain-containing protein [Boletus coccyginus]|nr:CHAT domain-containing protein [Boletus coccyginus]
MDPQVEQLHSRAEALVAKFAQGVGASHIEEVVDLECEAPRLYTPAHPQRPVSLIYLAPYLRGHHSRFAAMTAIMLSREALDLHPQGHPDRSMNNLAVDLYAWYEQLRQMGDLDVAIVLDREALALRPQGHPDQSISLNNLSVDLSTRYKQLRGMENLDEAIVLDREALTLHPQGHPDRSISLNSLAVDLSTRYQQLGGLKDLDEAIVLNQEALDLRLQGHPDRPFVLDREALALRPQGHPDQSISLNNLAVHLSTRYRRLGGMECLDEAIVFNRAALAPRLQGHPDRSMSLNNLAVDLCTRYKQLGGMEDIDEAIVLDREALDLRPQGHPDRSVSLSNIAVHLFTRYKQVGGIEDHNVTQDGVRDTSTELRVLTVRARRVDVARELAAFLRKPWDHIVEPIVDFLRTTRPSQSCIWWCPTAEFSALPLHAAGPYRNGQQNLPSIYISSYTPTLSALIRARWRYQSSSVSRRKRFIAIGQANAVGENELVSVGAELDNIGQRVDGLATFTRIDGEESCISRVTEELAKNEWVHLACHGLPNRKQPFESAFTLGDEHFSIQHIIGCDLENLEFAYLSARHTTVGDEESVDEVIHLASAMHFAGFRSVIGTMWAVDDGETNKITSIFHRYMVDESGRLDHTCAAFALNQTMKCVNVPFDQRILYIHLGA